jgi:hypothetical protein
MSQPKVPELLVEGHLYRSNTLKMDPLFAGLPVIDDNEGKSAAQLLREHQTEDIDERGFWSFQLLRHILSRDRIRNELRKYSNVNVETYLDHILPEVDPLFESGTPTYLKIFAILLLFDKGQEIVNFVRDRVSDQSLPLIRRPGTDKWLVELCRMDAPEHSLECLQKLDTHYRDSFESWQWKFLIPYFDLDENSMARHYSLKERTILPWCKRAKNPVSSTQQSKNDGGYAMVSCVKLDPLSHGFHGVLKEVCRSTLCYMGKANVCLTTFVAFIKRRFIRCEGSSRNGVQ